MFSSSAKPSKDDALFFQRETYLGWTGSQRIGNGLVEAVIVPSIGRVMQFRFAGSEQGPFWDNEALRGRLPEAGSPDWANFGGDKSWPAPQDDWLDRTGRHWPPPDAFDSLPAQTEPAPDGITLVSPICRHFGIKMIRRVAFRPGLPVMTITTEYQKRSGPPVRVAIWTITQLRDPERTFVLLPESSRFEDGFLPLNGSKPSGVRVDGRLLSLRRHPRNNFKIGTDGSSLLWMDPEQVLRIDAQRPAGEYPNGGSSAEVYASMDPFDYVELETTGPLATLRPGESLVARNTYTLTRRTSPDPVTEARKVFGLAAR